MGCHSGCGRWAVAAGVAGCCCCSMVLQLWEDLLVVSLPPLIIDIPYSSLIKSYTPHSDGEISSVLSDI